MEEIQGVSRAYPLQNPNLPDRQVRFCIAALQTPAKARLEAAGIRVLSPQMDPALPAEEQTHADLLFCHTGGETIFFAPSQAALAAQLQSHGFSPVKAHAPGGAYPENIRLNIAVGDDFAVGNFPHCDPLLLLELQKQKKTRLQVRQGYAKCSLCFVAARAMITEDGAIATALQNAGFDVLVISKGDVYLSERHYGFFGGAAGKIAPDVLAVNGSLRTHRDGARIAAFLQKYGVRPLSLHFGRITDTGGILPLTEKGELSLV